MVAVVKRGEIWVGNLNQARGRETGKIRPVLIFHADELLVAEMPLVIVLPLTSRLYPGALRFRVTVRARDRLLVDSQIMTDQPRALDRTRIADGPLTRLTETEMAAVEQSLLAVLGMM